METKELIVALMKKGLTYNKNNEYEIEFDTELWWEVNRRMHKAYKWEEHCTFDFLGFKFEFITDRIKECYVTFEGNGISGWLWGDLRYSRMKVTEFSIL